MADIPIYNITDTWNDGGTTFNGIKLDVTDTASHADSKLLDLQVGGASKFSVGKSGNLLVPDGSASAPAIGFNSDVDIGIHLESSSIVFDIAGARQWAVSSGGNWQGGVGRFIAWSSSSNPISGSPDLRLYRDAANTLAQRNGVNAQTFNIYNTYTDASNYERGFLKWNSNVLEIGTEADGTGTARDLSAGGYVFASASFNPPSSNTKSLGLGYLRWQAAYLGDQLDINQTAQTTDVPCITALARWNNVGVAFSAIQLGVTDTASHADSKLLDLQVGGASKFSVGKAGAIGLHGQTPPAQASHIADPSGGATTDAEARTAINSILTALEDIGILASS